MSKPKVDETIIADREYAEAVATEATTTTANDYINYYDLPEAIAEIEAPVADHQHHSAASSHLNVSSLESYAHLWYSVESILETTTAPIDTATTAAVEDPSLEHLWTSLEYNNETTMGSFATTAAAVANDQGVRTNVSSVENCQDSATVPTSAANTPTHMANHNPFSSVSTSTMNMMESICDGYSSLFDTTTAKDVAASTAASSIGTIGGRNSGAEDCHNIGRNMDFSSSESIACLGYNTTLRSMSIGCSNSFAPTTTAAAAVANQQGVTADFSSIEIVYAYILNESAANATGMTSPSAGSDRPEVALTTEMDQLSRASHGLASNRTSNNQNKMNRKKRKKMCDEGNVKEEDVLMGRGGRSNNHPGNARFLKEGRQTFLHRYRNATTNNEKKGIAQEMVDMVKNWGGRFLKLNVATQQWCEVDNKTAREKASQALRDMKLPIPEA